MEKNKDIGSYLKSKRESKNISIEHIATKTKININILRHLEANEIDHLPNRTYVKGFVKSYCRLLGLDLNQALEAFDNTYKLSPESHGPLEQQSAEETESVSFIVPPSSSSKIESTTSVINEEQLHAFKDKIIGFLQTLFKRNILISLAALVVGTVVLKAVVTFFVQLNNEQKQFDLTKDSTPEEVKVVTTTETTPPNLADKEAPVQETDESIKGKDQNLFDLEASKKLQQAIKLETPKIETPKNAVAETKAETPEVEIKPGQKNQKTDGKFPFVKFYTAPSDMFEVVADAPENKDEELFPSRYRNAIEADKQNIFIHATSGDTWIGYQSDNEEIKRFILKKGRSVLIKGNVILLFMGNINVAHIFYNNQLIKTYSKTGVKSLIFPESEARNYELPLFPSHNGVPYKAKDYKANMVSE